jgi:hypothetical protein
MKISILMLISAVMLLTACKKNHITKTEVAVTGTWELRAMKGGNLVPTNYPQGNGHLITFQNNAYIDYSGSIVVTQGNFMQHADNSGNVDISFSSGELTSESALFQDDTLRLKPSNIDAATAYYVKQQ